MLFLHTSQHPESAYLVSLSIINSFNHRNIVKLTSPILGLSGPPSSDIETDINFKNEESEDPEESLRKSSKDEVVIFVAEYNEKAMLEYVYIGNKFAATNNKSWHKKPYVRCLQVKAQRHLSYLGWKFWYYKKSGRKELLYRSPKDRALMSLLQACLHCMKEEGLSIELLIHETFYKPRKLFTSNIPFNTLCKKKAGHLKNKSDRNVFASLIGSNVVLLEKKVQYISQENHYPFAEGFITRDGISCTCCHKIFMVPRFESHADNNKSKDGAQIYLEDGRSLLDCQLQMANQKEVKSLVTNDDTSNDQKEVKSLVMDDDTSNGQKEVKSLVTDDDTSNDQKEVKSFVTDDDTSNDQKEVKRLVMDDDTSNDQKEVKSLVTDDDTSNDQKEVKSLVMDDDTCLVCHTECDGVLIFCDKCPSSYHQKCIRLEEIHAGNWFFPPCLCRICGKISLSDKETHNGGFFNCHKCQHNYHQECLKEVIEANHEGDIPKDNFYSKKCQRIYIDLESRLGRRVAVGKNLKWTLWKGQYSRNGPDKKAKSYKKLKGALDAIHECFVPSKDNGTKEDIVDCVVFCKRSEKKHLDFKGFYTVILEKNNCIVCAATVRIHGEKVAKLPFIGTKFQYRRSGMCRVLIDKLEKVKRVK